MPSPELNLSNFFETVLLIKRKGDITFVNGHPSVLLILHDYDNVDPRSNEVDIMRGENYSTKYAGRPETIEKLNMLMENIAHEKDSQTDQSDGSGDPDSPTE